MSSVPFHVFRSFGLVGVAIIVLAIVYSSLRYRGKQGERFSLLNHFISELGERGVSQGAWAFNAGLILGGVAATVFVIGLGIAFGSVLGWLGTVAGIVTTLGVTAVGIFPMDNLNAHVVAASTYFRAGLAMVFFFGLAILFQPAGRTFVPAMTNLLSLLAFLAYGSFLLLPAMKKPGPKPANPLDPQQVTERPKIWALPVLEWAVFFSTVAWLLGIALLAQV